MDRKLTEFTALLRNNGLRVSPPEVADAVAAIRQVGYADRQRFHDVLAATLAKSPEDAAILTRCFEQFFHFGLPEKAEAETEQPTTPRLTLPAGLQFLLGQGQAGGRGGNGAGQPVPGVPPSPLGEQLLATDNSELALNMAQAVESSRLLSIRVLTQKGLFGRRLLMDMGLEALEAEIAALETMPSPQAVFRAAALRQRLNRLRGQVRDTVERYFRLARNPDRDVVWRETDFALLKDAKEAEAVIRRMAKRLIAQHRRREKRAARGLLDVRATLRHNLSHDGVLIHPRWRRIRKDRPKVMAVCDVSGSVNRYSRFLLLFLYSLQEVIPRLRSFAFSSSLHEVTGLFESLPLACAMDAVQERYGMGSSDYGRSFVDLEKLALADIDHKTTLIILGDARNNNGEPRLDLLRAFHRRAKQVIWLNPEDASRWGSGDSEMHRYRSACTRVHACRSLGELERIVDRLLR